MYKKKYYNFIVVCLLLIISLAAGTSMGMAFNTKINIDDEFSQGENQPPVYEEPSESQTFGGLSKPGLSADAMSRIEYAIAVVNHSIGYTSETIFDLDVLGNNQYIFFKKYRGNNYDIVEEWYKATGLASNILSNYFGSYLGDGSNCYYIETKNGKLYSYDTKKYTINDSYYKKIVEKEKYIQSRSGVYINDFFAKFNKDTTNILNYDTGRGKDYYTIKAIIDGEFLKKQYFAKIEKYDLLNLSMDAINVTFKIDKKTGFLMNYELTGVFFANVLGVQGSASLLYKENYISMNKSAENAIRAIAKSNFGIEQL